MMPGGSGDWRCRSSPWFLLLGSWRGLREKQGKNEEKITEKWRGEAEKDESKGGKKKKRGKRKVLWHGSVVGPLFLDFFGWNHNWVKCAKRVGLGNWSILSDEWWEKKKKKQTTPNYLEEGRNEVLLRKISQQVCQVAILLKGHVSPVRVLKLNKIEEVFIVCWIE